MIKSEETEYNFERYPETENASLRAWGASDEHVLKYLEEMNIHIEDTVIYNDRFGFLTCVLHDLNPVTIINEKSQEKACRINLDKNDLSIDEIKFLSPLDQLPGKVKLSIIKIPKSLELFRLQLSGLSKALDEDSLVLCPFMTRHFTTQFLIIANEYFENVEQSRAWKKSRLLILKQPKKAETISITKSIPWKEKEFKQYFGIFSSGNIDYATQFLLENLRINEEDKTVLDLASGNGVIGSYVREQNPKCELHLLDDSFLAVESSKFNLSGENTYFHYNDTLEEFEENFFDLVVSNPPFHFEYETNIEIPIRLFGEVERCLKPGGRFLVVASKHLNFKTHLDKIFGNCYVVADNNKFIIYECSG
jgi:23S rRNA (guanine1835-N2)-methyltransferase